MNIHARLRQQNEKMKILAAVASPNKRAAMRIASKRIRKEFETASLSLNGIMNLLLVSVQRDLLTVEEAAAYMVDYERRQREKFQCNS